MSTYGYDNAWNKVEVADSTTFNALAATVLTKQAKLNATQGAEQTDCNTLTETGIYYIPVTANNKPSNTTYTLLVFPIDDEGSQISQIAISSGGTLMYYRVYSFTVWTSWVMLASNLNVIDDSNESSTKTWSSSHISEKVGFELTATLEARTTSLVFEDSRITENSTIFPYAWGVWGVSPISITVTNGSITLGFESRQEDLPVKVRVW